MRQLVPTLAAMSCLTAAWAAETSPSASVWETDAQVQLDEVLVTSSRLDIGLPGASSSVIDAETIALAPVQSLPELLSYQAGIQHRDLYNNTGGSGAGIDMRGFGAANSANALIMINGRRLNDIDLTFVDLGNIPLESIQHIEIIR